MRTRAPASTLRTDRAVVLRRFAFGESSLVAHLVGGEHGRVHVLAKGAFRPKSAYFAALDLFDTVELGWRARRGETLGTLVSARVLVSRRRLARDLGRFRAAEAVLALAGLGAREDARDPGLLRQVELALDTLGDERIAPEIARLAFEFAFLDTMGVGVALGTCASCGSDPGPAPSRGAPFSVAAGGRLCAACLARATRAREPHELVRPDVLRIAERLVAAPAAGLRSLRLSPVQAAGVDRLAARFLAWHLEPGTRQARAWAARLGSVPRTG